jgi:hypothetical protein
MKTRDDHRVSNTIIDYLYTEASQSDYRVVVYADRLQVRVTKKKKRLDCLRMLVLMLLHITAMAWLIHSKIGTYFSKATARVFAELYRILLLKLKLQPWFIPGGQNLADKNYKMQSEHHGTV